MQVQKYKLGNALFERNFETGAYYCATTDDWLSEDGLKLAGATPLIECKCRCHWGYEECSKSELRDSLSSCDHCNKEKELDEDVETISDFVCYTDGKVHPSALANTIAEIHRRINALQKGKQ